MAMTTRHRFIIKNDPICNRSKTGNTHREREIGIEEIESTKCHILLVKRLTIIIITIIIHAIKYQNIFTIRHTHTQSHTHVCDIIPKHFIDAKHNI